MDEIVLALELAFFQAQDQGDVNLPLTLVYIQKSWIYTEVVDLLKPIADPPDIDHKAINSQGSRRLHRGQPTYCLGFQSRTRRPSMPRMQGLTYSLRPPRYQRLVASSSVKEIKTSFNQGSVDGC
jgi:hypothetical protein